MTVQMRILVSFLEENDDLNVLEFLQKEAFGRVCDYRGYINETADGLCNCKNNVLGKTCNNCQKGFWNLMGVNNAPAMSMDQ